jgi:hypothetical protein
MKLTADDVQTVVFPGIGHRLAGQAPDEMVAALMGIPEAVPKGTRGIAPARCRMLSGLDVDTGPTNPAR